LVVGIVGILFSVLTLSQARYIDPGYQSVNRYSLIRLLTTAPKSDPELKEGVISWVKDQLDPELLKTWYGLSVGERLCVQSAVTMIKPPKGENQELPEKLPQEVVDFIENLCPSVLDQTEDLYAAIRKFAYTVKEWHDNFMKDLPESIRAPMEKIRRLSKTIKKTTTEEDFKQLAYETFSTIEEILTASEEDREVLAGKHEIMAPFVTGNLRDDTLKFIETLKTDVREATAENEAETTAAFKRLLTAIKADLLSYFKSRPRTATKLPENIDRELTTELSIVYDVAYAAGAQAVNDLLEVEN